MPHIWGGADLVRPLSSHAASRFSHFHMRPIARAGLYADDSLLDTSGSSFVVETTEPQENDELPGSAAPTAQTPQPRQLEMNCLYYGVSHGALGVLSCRQVVRPRTASRSSMSSRCSRPSSRASLHSSPSGYANYNLDDGSSPTPTVGASPSPTPAFPSPSQAQQLLELLPAIPQPSPQQDQLQQPLDPQQLLALEEAAQLQQQSDQQQLQQLLEQEQRQQMMSLLKPEPHQTLLPVPADALEQQPQQPPQQPPQQEEETPHPRRPSIRRNLSPSSDSHFHNFDQNTRPGSAAHLSITEVQWQDEHGVPLTDTSPPTHKCKSPKPFRSQSAPLKITIPNENHSFFAQHPNHQHFDDVSLPNNQRLRENYCSSPTTSRQSRSPSPPRSPTPTSFTTRYFSSPSPTALSIYVEDPLAEVHVTIGQWCPRPLHACKLLSCSKPAWPPGSPVEALPHSDFMPARFYGRPLTAGQFPGLKLSKHRRPVTCPKLPPRNPASRPCSQQAHHPPTPQHNRPFSQQSNYQQQFYHQEQLMQKQTDQLAKKQQEPVVRQQQPQQQQQQEELNGLQQHLHPHAQKLQQHHHHHHDNPPSTGRQKL